eukprot:TRINITY_DN421_c0_g1_i13.p1 TRINITY_DN421_c0_g1~~TRINITY_DN421_c0_g1_i13.p1  ORF type:complete len:227 (-),score=45.20 TRINITY_DN421_c0_g1_i13:4-684(-)
MCIRDSYICMGMLSEGMREEAAKQMNDYFRFNPKFDQGLEVDAVIALNKIFNMKQLQIANGIFTSKRCPMNNYFSNIIRNKYSGQPFDVDFGSQEGITSVNNWVSKVTQGKISQILDRPDPQIMLILANAIYFKANWKFQFEKEETQKLPFTNHLGEKFEATYMFQKNSFRHQIHGKITLLELQYDECPMSMVIAMSETGKPITIEESLVHEFIEGVGLNLSLIHI